MEIKQMITIAVLALVFWSWLCWALERWCKRQVLPRRRNEDEGREAADPGR